MTIVQRIKCDTCNAEKRWSLDADKNPHQIPNGWWSMVESDCDPWHFCSQDCLATFVNRWRPVRLEWLPAVVS